MKKGDVFEDYVVDFTFPNKSTLIHIDENGVEYTVKLKGGIQGQKLKYSVKRKKENRVEGIYKELIEKSPLETVTPPCGNFGPCGGCTYQTISYEQELKYKEKMVKELLEAVSSDFEYEPIVASPTAYCYRNKMEFTFGDEYKGGPLALGLHKKNSFHDIVDIHDCKLVNNDFNIVIDYVRNICLKYNLKFYNSYTRIGYLRHLVVRRATKTGEMIVNLITTSAYSIDTLSKDVSEKQFENELIEGLMKLETEGNLVGIIHTYNDGAADTCACDKMKLLSGREYFYEEILGLRFKITPFSFFQTNSLGAELLYNKARGYVGDTNDRVVFDLYTGTGTIAQMLAKVAKKVVGVEIVEQAVEAAKENAKLNGLNNVSFLAGDVLKMLDEIEDKPDLIVVDPPRDGINQKALIKIINYNVPKIVYISCKPTSLARDVEIFEENGYKLIKAGAVDMFPHTGHVETVVALHRTNS